MTTNKWNLPEILGLLAVLHLLYEKAQWVSWHVDLHDITQIFFR